MSKYIIDTETWANLFEVQRVGVYGIGNDIVTDEKTVWSRMFRLDELEELNSDYINEHFSDMQDTAYQKGLEEGKKQAKVQAHLDVCHDIERVAHGNYQKGLDDAWEAARKIIRMPDRDILDLFPDCYASVCTAVQAILKYDASEAIAKLKAYEGKQKDRIEVGDEVIYNGVTKCVVVTPETDVRYASLFDCNGIHYSADHRECKKTGKHYDIQSILGAMKS